MARPAWTGAITFAGFPINVRAYNLVKSRSAQSFKNLCPCHGLPIEQQIMCAVEGEVIPGEDLVKGVEVSKDAYSPLDPQAVEQIKSAERSVSLDVERFAPVASVPLHLSIGRFRLVPDEKIAGSDGPVGILWNGLRATERAAITTWVMRAGSRDSLVAIHADTYGLTANTIPYVTELVTDVPEWKPEHDDKARVTFEQFVTANYTLDDFSHPAYESDYEARRAEMIEKALAGEVIAAPDAPKPTAAAPDLMAAMSAALDSAKPAGKKAPAKSKPKAAAKS